jgi:hypothetical protein
MKDVPLNLMNKDRCVLVGGSSPMRNVYIENGCAVIDLSGTRPPSLNRTSRGPEVIRIPKKEPIPDLKPARSFSRTIRALIPSTLF